MARRDDEGRARPGGGDAGHEAVGHALLVGGVSAATLVVAQVGGVARRGFEVLVAALG